MSSRNFNILSYWKFFIFFIILSVIYTKINNENYLVSSGYNSVDGECNFSSAKDYQEFYDHINTVKLPCENLVMMGGKGGDKTRDGAKALCMDTSFNINPNECLVLSFGISTDWSFDKDMEKYGCNVHSFDPTIGIKEDFDKTPRLHFHNLGISNIQGIKSIRNKPCKVDRFENILKNLDIIDKKIDYLKMDVEGSEREFFADIFPNATHLLKNVMQIGMEVHIGNIPPIHKNRKIKGLGGHFDEYWNFFKFLECIGFKIVTSSMNVHVTSHFMYNGREEAKLYEILWARSL
ncbi:UNVERIFIED_CONTAM: hypothetical protein RMT77_011976 [Armadillidium vulgare]